MDYFTRFRKHLQIHTFFAILLPGLVAAGGFIILRELLETDLLVAGLAGLGLLVCGTYIAYAGLVRGSAGPLKAVWQAILHIRPEGSSMAPPNLNEISVKSARELVSTIVMQIYDMAGSQTVTPATSSSPAPHAPTGDTEKLLASLPLAILIFNKDRVVKAANLAAMDYLGLSADKLISKNLHDVLPLSFKTDDTLDGWLEAAGSKVIDTHTWHHARLTTPSGDVRQFDMSASYSKDNPSGNEVVLALFDRTKAYSSDDTATSYVAIAVHELRTPLTLLRGYVEMFEDELGPTLSPEHREFMRKMSASAQSLVSFVNNILNTSSIDESQFVVRLQEADWGKVLREIVSDLELRAQVRNKRLLVEIGENIPSVAIDRLAIYEVVGNLVENAIKYGGQSTDINISVGIGKDGMVETTVEDHGAGMPESVVGGLFTKFYRSHRSKSAVGGNGLGLYLVKSIVNAHGGNVWVNSREGEGSRFTFSLQPYENIKDHQDGHSGIEHQAGGWIKNHSLYRR